MTWTKAKHSNSYDDNRNGTNPSYYIIKTCKSTKVINNRSFLRRKNRVNIILVGIRFSDIVLDVVSISSGDIMETK